MRLAHDAARKRHAYRGRRRGQQAKNQLALLLLLLRKGTPKQAPKRQGAQKQAASWSAKQNTMPLLAAPQALYSQSALGAPPSTRARGPSPPATTRCRRAPLCCAALRRLTFLGRQLHLLHKLIPLVLLLLLLRLALRALRLLAAAAVLLPLVAVPLCRAAPHSKALQLPLAPPVLLFVVTVQQAVPGRGAGGGGGVSVAGVRRRQVCRGKSPAL